MDSRELKDLLERYARGKCSPEEEEIICKWYDEIGEQDADGIATMPDPVLEEKLWAAVNPVKAGRSRWTMLKKAAIITIPLLLLVSAGLYFTQHRVSPIGYFIPLRDKGLANSASRFFNEGTTEKHIRLADGSAVTLQPSSELIVRHHFNARRREVELTGEAFFHVHRNPDKPFYVFAGDIVTKVLGTSFNVRAYKDAKEVTVAVRTGKVSVYARRDPDSDHNPFQEPEVILTPNQQIVYHREKEAVSKELVAKPEIILPNSNLFRMQFENAPVATIFAVLEENYGVEIRYDRELLKNCRLTTSMSDEGLYERIEVICKAIGASYSRDNAVITIRSNGC